MTNNLNTIKSIIVNTVGDYYAGEHNSTINVVAAAISNRGDQSYYDAILDALGGSLSTYSTYVYRVISALEAADSEEAMDEPLKDIRSTVLNALPAGIEDSYSEEIEAVIAALEERDYAIAENVLDAVVENTSFSAEEVKPFGERAGLTFRPVPVAIEEPVIADDEENDVDSDDEAVGVDSEVKGKKAKRIAELEKRVGGIESSVAELLALAKRHLGA